MRIFKQKRVVIGFVIGAIFILFVTAESYSIMVSYQGTIDSISHTNAIQTYLSQLSIEVDNAGLAVRSYIVTENSTYLEPYPHEVTSLNSTMLTLQGLVAGDSNLTSSFAELQDLVNGRVIQLDMILYVKNSQGFAAAQAIVNSDIAQQYMSKIRGLVETMTAYLTQLQSQNRILASSQSGTRLSFAYITAAGAIGIIGFSLYSIDRNLREEERARRQAELLQDILTHDIRNYNQVSRLSAELLENRIRGDGEYGSIATTLIESIDGSTALVDRAKRLGRVLSEKKAKLRPVSLMETVEDSIVLVKNAYGDRKSVMEKTFVKFLYNDGSKKSDELDDNIFVQADDLIGDVFTNLYSNSVKYTDSNEVRIETLVEEQERHWRVYITDEGRGIHDDQKERVFSRYLKTAKGTGLGMSIIHALVVDRYKGRVRVADRVPGDYTKGTAVEILLHKAKPPTIH